MTIKLSKNPEQNLETNFYFNSYPTRRLTLIAKSGIKIKPQNKGKFTEYCGGKVTNECIQRGKHSSDPKIRKRATFADNARHFKHSFGGQLFQNGGYFINYTPYGGEVFQEIITKDAGNYLTDIKIPSLSSSSSSNQIRSAPHNWRENTSGNNTPISSGNTVFDAAMEAAIKANPEIARYRKFMTALAKRESSFRPTIKNNKEPAYGYFQLMQGVGTNGRQYNNIVKYAGTEDIEAFKNDPVLQIQAAFKMIKENESNLKRELGDDGLEKARKLGFDMWGLLGGSWLGGVGSRKRMNGTVGAVLNNYDGPSDVHGTTISQYMREFTGQG